MTVSGAGLTWTLVKRTNARPGGRRDLAGTRDWDVDQCHGDVDAERGSDSTSR